MREVGVLERAKAHAAIQRIRARAERHRPEQRRSAGPVTAVTQVPPNQRPRGRKAGLPYLDTMKMLTGIFGI
jgi:hypothetical protein